MGSWGAALYSDDLALDLRSDFRDLIGEGHTAEAALDRLMEEYDASFADADEGPVCWLAVAETAWKLGRPVARATTEALRVIESGADLQRWDDPRDRKKRRRVLEQVAETLRSPPPPQRRVVRPFKAANQWAVGEVIAYRLASGQWTAFRVLGHHTDKGGRFAVCEPLNWTGAEPPQQSQIERMGVRPSLESGGVSQFLLGEPRRKADAERLVRTGCLSVPSPRVGMLAVFIFPRVDRGLKEVFGLE